MKKTIILILFLAGQSFISLGQNFKQQFNDLCNKHDTIGQEKILLQWRTAKANDPELYVAYFNFFVKKSMTEMIRVDKNAPKGKDALQLTETDATKKDPAGYMYSETYYKPEILGKGFSYIDTAIQKFPDRLDMRFGKIYMLGQTEDFEKFTREIIKAIDHSGANKNDWLWTDNIKKEKPKDFFLSSLQDYQLQLYNTNSDDLLENMKQIAEAILKLYPDHVESLSNISIVYLIKKEYDKALEALFKAEKFAPTDYIVLSNTAHTYKLKGDVKNAIKYYELTEKHGDESAKHYAQEQIAELKKK